MATLNLPGFTLGLPVWFFSTPTILNAPDASQVSSLYQWHQNTASPSLVFDSPPPSTSCGESTNTSNRQSKRSKRRRNRKNAHKKGAPIQPLQVNLKITTQPLQFMMGAPIQPLQVMLDLSTQPLQVKLIFTIQPLLIMLVGSFQPIQVMWDIVNLPLQFMLMAPIQPM